MLSSGKIIQKNEHCSVEDSCAALELYKLVEEQWEADATTGVYPQKNKAAAKRKRASKIGNSTSKRRRLSGSGKDSTDKDGLILNVTYESKRTRTFSNDYLGDEFWPDNLTT